MVSEGEDQRLKCRTSGYGRELWSREEEERLFIGIQLEDQV